MAIRTLGPGSLTIGEAGSSKEWGGDISKISLEPSTKGEDPIPLLDGTDELGEDTTTWALKGTALQDYTDLQEFAFWAAANAGKELPFVFVPTAAGGVQATGTCKVRPVVVGGDVKKKNSADFEFPVSGTPTFATHTPTP